MATEVTGLVGNAVGSAVSATTVLFSRELVVSIADIVGDVLMVRAGVVELVIVKFVATAVIAIVVVASTATAIGVAGTVFVV